MSAGIGFDSLRDYHFNMQVVSCQHLKDFMKTQLEVIARHLDEHKYLRNIQGREEAVESFIQDYGWLMREMYCTKICKLNGECEIATQMSSSGDLLRHHLKK